MILTLGLCLAAMSRQDVFVSGRIDPAMPYDTFRIPAICRTANGTLLAFAEGRRSVSDQASNVIVLRRRLPDSKNWEPIQVVVKDEPASLNNPCVIATSSGKIWMAYQRYPAGVLERNALPGFDPAKSCLTFVISCTDDGKTWSAPRDISQVVKHERTESVAAGPGAGIELQNVPHKGRLVFPFNEGIKGQYNVFCVYSDDEGRTWKRGGNPPKARELQPNETQIAECADGSILMNCRNQAAGRFRLQTVSRDQGLTWEAITPRPDLVDPVCQGAIMSLHDDLNTLVFSNPANAQSRTNGVLRVSRDNGKTWSDGQLIESGSFAYSALCSLGGGKIGVLYETVDDLGEQREGYRIRYVEMEIE